MPKITKKIKLQISAGKATPAPPVGTMLGPAGINIGDFVSKFNEATKDKMGSVIPVEVSIYEDRSFNFVLKTPPASDLLKKAAGIEKGSGKNAVSRAGKISKAKVREIAEIKLPDLNTIDPDKALKTIAGTARSMGIEVIN